MSNRIYPVTKEKLESGDYAIVQSHVVPEGHPKFFFQEKPFGQILEGWDDNHSMKEFHDFIVSGACGVIAAKFDVPLREVLEGVNISKKEGWANMYSDEVYSLIQHAADYRNFRENDNF